MITKEQAEAVGNGNLRDGRNSDRLRTPPPQKIFVNSVAQTLKFRLPFGIAAPRAETDGRRESLHRLSWHRRQR